MRLPLIAFVIASLQAEPVVSPWVPIFKGVDLSVSTNIPSNGEFPNRQVVSAIRVDLRDPDIRLLTTPRIETNFIPNVREVAGFTVSDFVDRMNVQVGINASFFDPEQYYLPAGYPMYIRSLGISEGVVVSEQNTSRDSAVLTFDRENRPSIIPTNWPAQNMDGVWTAVSGNQPLVVNGENIAPRSGRFDAQPRTVFGISEDRRYLYLVAIDGRQDGYSDGASDYESAGWLLLLGAHDGINVDGGGSTTLVMEDSTGAPIRLNRSSAVADSGRERTVGSHFGVFAKPLPGFINDVVVAPEGDTARITWITQAPATSEVEYGTTPEFGVRTGLQTDLTTNHVVQLTGLSAGTGYYFRAISSTNGTEQFSDTFFFTTTNFVQTREVFGITNSWKFTRNNLDGISWTAPDYDDASWSGPGPGLLWVDTRSSGPNPLVEPKNTEMPANSGSGYPYITYYLRTRFSLASVVAGTSLKISAFVDDGAVFYLNGAEIWRLRVPEGAVAETLASGFGCEGDATCMDEILIPSNAITNLMKGQNILAVEVHNYNARSSDITFGAQLDLIEPLSRTAELVVQRSSATLSLTWESPGFILQQSESPLGPWIDVPGGETSPFSVGPSETRRFYRLRR